MIAELLADAKTFDGAVITGDFNAQEPWEYDIFKKTGCTCANCSGRFGVTATRCGDLRPHRMDAARARTQSLRRPEGRMSGCSQFVMPGLLACGVRR